MGDFRVYLMKSDGGHALGGTGHEELMKTPYKALTKDNIFENFVRTFGTGDNITILADNVNPKTLAFITDKGFKNVIASANGGSRTWSNMFLRSLKECADEDIVYFCEDDYIHAPDAEKYIREALEVGHYVTLYDSLDKYIDSDKGGNNPLIKFGGELTRVIITKSTHWKFTNSTTSTFASKIKTLKEDYSFIMGFCSPPYIRLMDFNLFQYLINQRQRILLSPIPGRSAHVGMEMPPFINWLKYIKE